VGVSGQRPSLSANQVSENPFRPSDTFPYEGQTLKQVCPPWQGDSCLTLSVGKSEDAQMAEGERVGDYTALEPDG
jgi:hypothetical protein